MPVAMPLPGVKVPPMPDRLQTSHVAGLPLAEQSVGEQRVELVAVRDRVALRSSTQKTAAADWTTGAGVFQKLPGTSLDDAIRGASEMSRASQRLWELEFSPAVAVIAGADQTWYGAYLGVVPEHGRPTLTSIDLNQGVVIDTAPRHAAVQAVAGAHSAIRFDQPTG